MFTSIDQWAFVFVECLRVTCPVKEAPAHSECEAVQSPGPDTPAEAQKNPAMELSSILIANSRIRALHSGGGGAEGGWVAPTS